MEWFKRRLGLKIWLAVWLLVMLVPLWREDAREQWSGQNWIDSFAAPRGLTTEKVEAIAARAPDDVAAQLELVSAHRSGYYSSDPTVVATNFDLFARLSRRFPRENSVRQAWLIATTQGSLRIESDARYNASFPAPYRQTVRKNWLGTPQLEAGVQAARDGAQIEPQNSFFPWIEATLCFALQRPDNAMAALQRASKCAYFDDGITQTSRRCTALLSRVQSVGWKEKSHAMFGVLLPHLARIRSTARAAMEVSKQSQGRGEEARALQIAATVAQAGATISDYRGSLITAAVGDAVQLLAWSEALENAGREVKTPVFPGDDQSYFGRREFLPAREAHWGKIAQQVANYARELKQDAIVQQALAMPASLKSSRLAAVYGNPNFPGPFQGFNRLGKFDWLEMRLLKFSLGGAALWLATLGLSWRRPLTPQSKRSAASLGAFFLGVTAVLLGVGLALGLGSVPNFLYDESQKPPGLDLDFERKLNLIVALLWSLPLVLSAILSVIEVPGGRERRGAGAIRGVQIAIYSAIAASLAAMCLISGIERFPAFSPVQNNVTNALVWSLLAALFFHVAAAQKNLARLAALLFWLVPLIVLATTFDFETFSHSIWVIPTLALICLLVVSCLQLTPWRPASLRLDTRGPSLFSLLQTLLYTTILGSITVIFVITNSSSSPLFNENINTLLTYSLIAIVVVGGFHIIKAKGKARVAALLFWSVPLIFVTTRTMLHPEVELNLVVAWRFMALIFLVISARIMEWKPNPTIQRFGFDLMGRARILAATLAVASAVSYFGVKVAALPSEARMNSILDAQLKDGEVAWLETRLQ